jgi:hypothetical protein
MKSMFHKPKSQRFAQRQIIITCSATNFKMMRTNWSESQFTQNTTK